MTLSDNETIDLMARVLRCREADLGDERSVFRVLLAEGRFQSGEVLALYERAIERARSQAAENGSPQ